jgi:hypothetical protein
MIAPQATIRSPFSSLVIGMGHLMNFPNILTGRRTEKGHDAEALRDGWRAVGRDLWQAMHLYERLEMIPKRANGAANPDLVYLRLRSRRSIDADCGGEKKD